MLARSLFTMSASAVGQVGVEAAARGHVPDVGVRGHAVHGLDVERLLAVPARRVALVRPGQLYGPAWNCLYWPAANGWSPTPCRELVGVRLDGGRGVGVHDRDGLALAGHPGGGHPVGAADLARRVAAVGPRLELAVRLGLVGRGLLAVVGRARLGDPVVRPGRRQRRLDLALRGVQAGHREDRAGDGRGCAWPPGRVPGRSGRRGPGRCRTSRRTPCWRRPRTRARRCRRPPGAWR